VSESIEACISIVAQSCLCGTSEGAQEREMPLFRPAQTWDVGEDDVRKVHSEVGVEVSEIRLLDFRLFTSSTNFDCIDSSLTIQLRYHS